MSLVRGWPGCSESSSEMHGSGMFTGHSGSGLLDVGEKINIYLYI